jgi:hypothetical protein
MFTGYASCAGLDASVSHSLQPQHLLCSPVSDACAILGRFLLLHPRILHQFRGHKSSGC